MQAKLQLEDGHCNKCNL